MGQRCVRRERGGRGLGFWVWGSVRHARGAGRVDMSALEGSEGAGETRLALGGRASCCLLARRTEPARVFLMPLRAASPPFSAARSA